MRLILFLCLFPDYFFSILRRQGQLLKAQINCGYDGFPRHSHGLGHLPVVLELGEASSHDPGRFEEGLFQVGGGELQLPLIHLVKKVSEAPISQLISVQLRIHQTFCAQLVEAILCLKHVKIHFQFDTQFVKHNEFL